VSSRVEKIAGAQSAFGIMMPKEASAHPADGPRPHRKRPLTVRTAGIKCCAGAPSDVGHSAGRRTIPTRVFIIDHLAISSAHARNPVPRAWADRRGARPAKRKTP